MTQSVTFTRPRRTKAAVAVLAIGLASFAPAAFAQGPAERGDRQMQRGEHQQHANRDHMRGNRMGGPRGGNMLLGLGCGPNAAQRIEHALVSLTYRIEATDDQKALIDDLKSTALAAQAEFAEVCQTVLPRGTAMGGPMGEPMMDDAMAPPAPMGDAADAPPAPDAMAAAPDASPDAAPAPGAAPARPNMLEMMQARLKLEEARVAALGEVLPKFEALYNALSDEQKASLEPMHGKRGMDGDHGPRQGHRNGRNG